MRSPKKYTTQTYTKRVDYTAGSHRLPQAMAEPAVCKICGDVYADRRWTLPEAQRAQQTRPTREVVCPACKRQADNLPSGYVYLVGAFLRQHFTEITQLLQNEAARAASDNPLARIMELTQEGAEQLTITTTTEHLAQRLGHAVNKAYDGAVRYDFSHENKLARVYWRRD
ncbi:MAG TPA: BCAM0308 family protein [Blastocatellia bacterium]|nr:BCAM0308 family protein [Blastocatellia bacterium]